MRFPLKIDVIYSYAYLKATRATVLVLTPFLKNVQR